jgi:hypothetical protein
MAAEGRLSAVLEVGMAASGSVLLAPVPAAAAAYAATILIPLVFKCLIVLGDRYVALGALAVSFLVFLLALIATNGCGRCPDKARKLVAVDLT